MRFSILTTSVTQDASPDPGTCPDLSRFIAENNISCASISNDNAAVERAPGATTLASEVGHELDKLGLKYTCVEVPDPNDARRPAIEDRRELALLVQLPVLGMVSPRPPVADSADRDVPIVGVRLAHAPDMAIDIYSVRYAPAISSELLQFVDESLGSFEQQWEHDHRRHSRGRPFTHARFSGPETRMVAVAVHAISVGDAGPDGAMADNGFVAATFGEKVADRMYLKPAIKPTQQRVVEIPATSGYSPVIAALAVFEV